MATLGQTWRTLRDRFGSVGIDTAALDARLLVRHVLGLDDTGLIACEPDPFPVDRAAALEALALRRIAGEPVARIRGVQEFYGLEFGLNAATLVPRPETEMLVDFGIAMLRDYESPRILDLGTGTGCIVLALLDALPGARGVGVDISKLALDQAQANAEALGVKDQFAARQGDWFEPVGGERFDLIVSNPPYIATSVIATLDVGVREFDPGGALDGGEDGLDPYRIFAEKAAGHLSENGALALEIGFDQGQLIVRLLQAAGFSDIVIATDLAGLDRMVTARAQK